MRAAAERSSGWRQQPPRYGRGRRRRRRRRRRRDEEKTGGYRIAGRDYGESQVGRARRSSYSVFIATLRFPSLPPCAKVGSAVRAVPPFVDSSRRDSRACHSIAFSGGLLFISGFREIPACRLAADRAYICALAERCSLSRAYRLDFPRNARGNLSPDSPPRPCTSRVHRTVFTLRSCTSAEANEFAVTTYRLAALM